MPIALALVMVLPIHVHATSGIPKPMLSRALAEAAIIWRDVGVGLEWYTGGSAPPSSLQVEVGDEAGRPMDGQWPLAWITFVDGVPDDTIHVSHANAVRLFEAAEVVRNRREAPVAMVNELVGRAIGRALAHEIGHYLFRSTMHDARGVMGTGRSAIELFGYGRDGFLLTSAERERLSAVLQRYRLAQRTPTPFR